MSNRFTLHCMSPHRRRQEMGHLRIIVAVSCLCYIQATTVNTENIDVEKFTLAESKSGRSPVFKPLKDNIAAPTYNRPPTNVVYGKAGKAARPSPQAYVAPSLKGKPVVSKFKPSVEDTGFDGDQISSYGYGQPYKPSQQETVALQKYMQRYANQVLNAQKHSAQLSDNQKQVISSDPYKKYIPSSNKYKFVPVFSKDSKDKYNDYDTVEINTEKYQSPFVMQPIVKTPPKKAFSFDSAQQPSEYKYNSEDVQLANQLMVEPEKSSWGGLEPYQYGIMAVEKTSDLSKITGFKIPAATSITLGHSIETKEEEKGHEHHEQEEHYPHHEPKYEYMYQVHDPEKHNNFGHSEARKGKNTWGRYYVQLPDGRLETVKYWVDKSGYHAEVDFKGEAKHPSHKEYAQQSSHKEHSHHEDSSKAYAKISDTAGLSGHSEAQFTLSDAIPVGEEY